MHDETPFLRVKEAARVLGVCPNTLRAWGGRGKVPEFRHPINGFRLYRRADLEAVLSAIRGSRRTGTAGAGEVDEAEDRGR